MVVLVSYKSPLSTRRNDPMGLKAFWALVQYEREKLYSDVVLLERYHASSRSLAPPPPPHPPRLSGGRSIFSQCCSTVTPALAWGAFQGNRSVMVLVVLLWVVVLILILLHTVSCHDRDRKAETRIKKRVLTPKVGSQAAQGGNLGFMRVMRILRCLGSDRLGVPERVWSCKAPARNTVCFCKQERGKSIFCVILRGLTDSEACRYPKAI